MIHLKNIVYVLFHKHKIELAKNGDWVCDTKLIGVFSDENKAFETIEKYKLITGFRDYPNDFVIDEINVDEDFDSKPSVTPTKIYRLTHEYEILEDGDIYDMLTEIGLYSSMEKAKSILEKYLTFDEFKAYPTGFEISEVDIDQCEWREGFDSWD